MVFWRLWSAAHAAPGAFTAIQLVLGVVISAVIDVACADASGVRRLLLVAAAALYVSEPGFNLRCSEMLRLDEQKAAALCGAERKPLLTVAVAAAQPRFRFDVLADAVLAAICGSAVGFIGGDLAGIPSVIASVIMGLFGVVVMGWSALARNNALIPGAPAKVPVPPRAATRGAAPKQQTKRRAAFDEYDGAGELSLSMDDGESPLRYEPEFLDADEAGAAYDDLANLLARVSESQAAPPKDSSGQNGRSQFYAAGELAGVAADGGALALHANPRWLRAAWRLAGDELATIARLWPRVEAATRRLLPDAVDAQRPNLFNSVLVNRYATGSAGIKWHSDAEKCYGASSEITIASLSLGAPRKFMLRRKAGGRSAGAALVLRPGSLLVMGGTMQERWQHALEADPTEGGCRINLTFRWCKEPRVVGRAMRPS
jgi:hypothetical protein